MGYDRSEIGQQYSRYENGISRAVIAPPAVANQPDVTGGVTDAAKDMDEALTYAHARIDALALRLEPVLRAAPPSGASVEAKSARPMGSQVSERLRGQVLGANAVVVRLDDLLERIDL